MGSFRRFLWEAFARWLDPLYAATVRDSASREDRIDYLNDQRLAWRERAKEAEEERDQLANVAFCAADLRDYLEPIIAPIGDEPSKMKDLWTTLDAALKRLEPKD